jgi:hypothetical protein
MKNEGSKEFVLPIPHIMVSVFFKILCEWVAGMNFFKTLCLLKRCYRKCTLNTFSFSFVTRCSNPIGRLLCHSLVPQQGYAAQVKRKTMAMKTSYANYAVTKLFTIPLLEIRSMRQWSIVKRET